MKKSKRPYYYKLHSSEFDIENVVFARSKIILLFMLFFFMLIVLRLFQIQVLKNEVFISKVEASKKTYTEDLAAPRGIIYDRFMNVLVDNTEVLKIVYKKPNDITTNEELEIAWTLSDLLELDYKYQEQDLREYFYLKNSQLISQRITDEEYEKYKNRIISYEELFKLKLSKITNIEIEEMDIQEKKASYIYNLMNKGYHFSIKEIKTDATAEEFAHIKSIEEDLSGISATRTYKRNYPYGTTFKSILGKVSSGIPKDLLGYYKDRDYKLDEEVGISNVELIYDDVLRGTKNILENNSGIMSIYKYGKQANDIVLTIDINLQQEVEKIIENELLKSRTEAKTEYLDHAFVVITNPQNGEIYAMAGKKIYEEDGEYLFIDYNPLVYQESVVVGSSVKGASQIVAYNNNALEIGEKRQDKCIKIASTPLKCSWKYLGNISDVDALKYSSNVYQFLSAIKIGNGDYSYNKPLQLDEGAFDIYRSGFAEFGLGVKTGIDLPNEFSGYKGNSKQSGHLLDYSIGQYDNYTTMQLSQYISTIANGGKRIKPQILKSIINEEKTIYNSSPEILNIVNTKEEYLEEVKKGFIEVMKSGGTGYSHIDSKYKPAGKTGTSESFIDTDNDGLVDTKTYSNTFVGYAPHDNPLVSFTVVSPNYSHPGGIGRNSSINVRISNQVSKKFFEIYK